MESVEHRNEDSGRDQEPQDISAANEPVLCAIGVDLCWCPNYSNSRLERGHERQGKGQALHAPVCQQELLCGLLPSSREGIIQPYGHRGHQEQDKQHKVNSSEFVSSAVHSDKVKALVRRWGKHSVAAAIHEEKRCTCTFKKTHLYSIQKDFSNTS